MYVYILRRIKRNVCFKAQHNIKNIKRILLFDIYALKKLQLFPNAYLNIKRVIHCLSSDCFWYLFYTPSELIHHVQHILKIGFLLASKRKLYVLLRFFS